MLLGPHVRLRKRPRHSKLGCRVHTHSTYLDSISIEMLVSARGHRVESETIRGFGRSGPTRPGRRPDHLGSFAGRTVAATWCAVEPPRSSSRRSRRSGADRSTAVIRRRTPPVHSSQTRSVHRARQRDPGSRWSGALRLHAQLGSIAARRSRVDGESRWTGIECRNPPGRTRSSGCRGSCGSGRSGSQRRATQ